MWGTPSACREPFDDVARGSGQDWGWRFRLLLAAVSPSGTSVAATRVGIPLADLAVLFVHDVLDSAIHSHLATFGLRFGLGGRAVRTLARSLGLVGVLVTVRCHQPQ